MNPNLEQALFSIYSNQEKNSGDYDEKALFAVVEEFGLPNLGDRIYTEIPPTVPFELVCILFDLLAWRTDDNGSSVRRATERWLIEGRDERRMLIALHLEAYPFISEEEMVEVLSKLKSTNPQITHRCAELVRMRTGV
ncbi:UNVERIFIED_ORG: hypothetical protein DFO49_4074 [Herbaspirillum seropedicae]